jgi:hypothetical protein
VLEDSRCVWGEERVYFLGEKGVLKRIPASWTSIEKQDPFVVISASRSFFRMSDLLRLVELVEERADGAV